MSNTTNFFEKQAFSGLERVILAEDILLPELPDKPLTLAYLEEFGEYKLAFNEYHDMQGKFFMNIMTPMVEKGEIEEKFSSSPRTIGHRGNELSTMDYVSTNFIILTIPKYILLNFREMVPKGTEFLIASIDGSLEVEDIKIIGIYSLASFEPEILE